MSFIRNNSGSALLFVMALLAIISIGVHALQNNVMGIIRAQRPLKIRSEVSFLSKYLERHFNCVETYNECNGNRVGNINIKNDVPDIIISSTLTDTRNRVGNYILGARCPLTNPVISQQTVVVEAQHITSDRWYPIDIEECHYP